MRYVAKKPTMLLVLRAFDPETNRNRNCPLGCFLTDSGRLKVPIADSIYCCLIENLVIRTFLNNNAANSSGTIDNNFKPDFTLPAITQSICRVNWCRVYCGDWRSLGGGYRIVVLIWWLARMSQILKKNLLRNFLINIPSTLHQEPASHKNTTGA